MPTLWNARLYVQLGLLQALSGLAADRTFLLHCSKDRWFRLKQPAAARIVLLLVCWKLITVHVCCSMIQEILTQFRRSGQANVAFRVSCPSQLTLATDCLRSSLRPPHRTARKRYIMHVGSHGLLSLSLSFVLCHFRSLLTQK